MSEQWKPVPGWEGLYEVSDEGRVRSLDRVALRGRSVQHYKGRIRRRRVNGGYAKVNLTGEGRRCDAVKVHQLVAAAFIGPMPNGQMVRHLNGDPLDNRVANLAYGTHQDNAQDAIRHGTLVKGERHRSAKLSEQKVKDIRKAAATTRALAQEYGVSQQAIWCIRQRRTWRHVA